LVLCLCWEPGSCPPLRQVQRLPGPGFTAAAPRLLTSPAMPLSGDVSCRGRALVQPFWLRTCAQLLLPLRLVLLAAVVSGVTASNNVAQVGGWVGGLARP
jgi:hypothetical protein